MINWIPAPFEYLQARGTGLPIKVLCDPKQQPIITTDGMWGIFRAPDAPEWHLFLLLSGERVGRYPARKTAQEAAKRLTPYLEGGAWPFNEDKQRHALNAIQYLRVSNKQ